MKSGIKLVLFSSGLVFGLAYLSLAIDGLYQPTSSSKANRKNASAVSTGSLSEIQVHKQPRPNFDDDLTRLSRMEQTYRNGERIVRQSSGPSSRARTRVAQTRTQKTTVRYTEQRRTGTQQAGQGAH